MTNRRHTRRSGQRTAGYGDPRAVYGIGPNSSGNYYVSAAGTALDGSDGMWRSLLLRIETSTIAVNNLFCNGNLGPTNAGWGVRIVDSLLYFQAADGLTAAVQSPSYTITAADVGKVMAVVGVHDGSNLRLYVNGAEVGSGTAISGFTGVGATGFVTVGTRRNFSGMSEECVFLGVAGSDSAALTAPQAFSLTAAYKRAGRVTTDQSPQYVWDVKTNGRDAPTAWPDSVADALDLDEVGTYPATGSFTAQWGW